MDNQEKTDMVKLLKAYEQWEADLIMSDEAWDNGRAALPTLTYPLYDKLLELQAERNRLLKGVR